MLITLGSICFGTFELYRSGCTKSPVPGTTAAQDAKDRLWVKRKSQQWLPVLLFDLSCLLGDSSSMHV